MSNVVKLRKYEMTLNKALIFIFNAPGAGKHILECMQKCYPDRTFTLDAGLIGMYEVPPIKVVKEWDIKINDTTLYFEDLDDGTTRLQYPYRGSNHVVLRFIGSVCGKSS